MFCDTINKSDQYWIVLLVDAHEHPGGSRKSLQPESWNLKSTLSFLILVIEILKRNFLQRGFEFARSMTPDPAHGLYVEHASRNLSPRYINTLCFDWVQELQRLRASTSVANTDRSHSSVANIVYEYYMENVWILMKKSVLAVIVSWKKYQYYRADSFLEME